MMPVAYLEGMNNASPSAPRTDYEDALDRISELEYTVEKPLRLIHGRSSEKRAINVETGTVLGYLFEDSAAPVPEKMDAEPKSKTDRKPLGCLLDEFVHDLDDFRLKIRHRGFDVTVSHEDHELVNGEAVAPT